MMTATMDYCLSMDRLVESVRALAALHLMSLGGDSPLGALMCDDRRLLLEQTLKDAFTGCVAGIGARVTDLDIDALKLTVAAGRDADSARHTAVGRVLEQMVAARALALWTAVAGPPEVGAAMEALASRQGQRLNELLALGPSVRKLSPL